MELQEKEPEKDRESYNKGLIDESYLLIFELKPYKS